MSTIEFACTSCGKKMKTGAANAGKKGKCPKCGAVLDIPLSPEQSLMPPTSPPAKPTNPAPAAETPVRPPARPKGPDELSGANANQDFLTELSEPAAGAAPALDGSQQDLFAGTDDAAAAYGTTSPGLTPLPTSAPQPAYTPSSYSPAPTYPAGNPYAAPAAPVYGGYAAPARSTGAGADGMGITSMILGIVGLVVSLLSCCLSSVYIGVFGYPISIIISIVGVILGHVARPSGMRTAGLVTNYINLGLYGLLLVIFIILLIFGVSMAALTPNVGR